MFKPLKVLAIFDANIHPILNLACDTIQSNFCTFNTDKFVVRNCSLKRLPSVTDNVRPEITLNSGKYLKISN